MVRSHTLCPYCVHVLVLRNGYERESVAAGHAYLVERVVSLGYVGGWRW
jgi:hypothetical protein